MNKKKLTPIIAAVAATVLGGASALASITLSGTDSGGADLAASTTITALGGGTYDGNLQITPANTENTSGNGSDPGADPQFGLASPTAIPKPSTILAGALLLLPVGASALRILRRNRGD